MNVYTDFLFVPFAQSFKGSTPELRIQTMHPAAFADSLHHDVRM